MEVKDLRELTVDELIDKLAEAKEAQSDYLLKLRTGQVTDTSEVADLKRNIAKILTVINEKHTEVAIGEGQKTEKSEVIEVKEKEDEKTKKDKEETK